MRDDRLYAGMIVLQSALYGVMDIVSKLVYRSMPIYAFLFLRYTLAFGLMLVLWNKRILLSLKGVPVRRYIVPSLCMALAFTCSNLALNYTTATNMSFIRSLSGLIVPLLLFVFQGVRVQRKEMALMAAMLVGLYLLCAKGGMSGFGLGELLSLASAGMLAGSLVFGRTALEHIPAASLSFVQSFLAAVLCGGLSVWTGTLSSVRMIARPELLLSLLYAVIGCTIGGYMLQNMALEHISSKLVGMLQCIYPVATAVIAFLILGEHLSVPGILGAGVILTCVFLENKLA